MNEPTPGREQKQHEAMGRVRNLLERDRIGADAARRRPWWSRVVALLLALAVVGLFALGLDAFLTAVQRLLDRPVPEAPTAVGKPGETPGSEAMPVFVVPEEDAASTPDGTPTQGETPTQDGTPTQSETPAPATPAGTTTTPPDDDTAPQ